MTFKDKIEILKDNAQFADVKVGDILTIIDLDVDGRETLLAEADDGHTWLFDYDQENKLFKVLSNTEDKNEH